MKPSSTLAFEHTQLPHGDDGKRVRGIICRCGHCEAAIPLPVNTIASNWSNDTAEVEWHFIARKLEAKGWRVGKSRTAHRCPKCLASAKFTSIRKSQQEFHTLTSTAVATGTISHNNNGAVPMKVVENTRVMGREDRRIIFEKLNEVYVDDKVGYSETWTDEKVATNLGVPRAWVKLIREENFGDEISNGDIRQRLIEATNALASIKAIEPDMRRLLSLADKIEKSLSEIQRVLK